MEDEFWDAKEDPKEGEEVLGVAKEDPKLVEAEEGWFSRLFEVEKGEWEDDVLSEVRSRAFRNSFSLFLLAACPQQCWALPGKSSGKF